jgi:hypothetical protein
MSYAGIISQISSYIHLSVRYMSNVKDIFDLKTELNYLLSKDRTRGSILEFFSIAKHKLKYDGQRRMR